MVLLEPLDQMTAIVELGQRVETGHFLQLGIA